MAINIKDISPPRIMYNASCIVCDVVNIEMIRYGALPLCKYCYREVFEEETDLDAASKNYKFYLDKYLRGDV